MALLVDVWEHMGYSKGITAVALCEHTHLGPLWVCFAYTAPQFTCSYPLWTRPCVFASKAVMKLILHGSRPTTSSVKLMLFNNRANL